MTFKLPSHEQVRREDKWANGVGFLTEAQAILVDVGGAELVGQLPLLDGLLLDPPSLFR